MNTVSKNISGTVVIILGLIVIIFGFSNPLALIYGIPIFIIGLFILANKKEDEIEKIKTSSEGGKKK